MKKYLALVLALMMLVLSACGTAQTDKSTENSNMSNTEASSDSSTTETPADTAEPTLPVDTVEAKRIEPMADWVDMSNLKDAAVAAGFDGDAVTEENGKYQIKLTVYSYDMYDMVDMAQLDVGDTIVVDGKDMVVSSKEEDNGVIAVNGGYENGGAYFATGEDGVYYVIGPDDRKDYHEVGTATVPVSDDFTMTDNSDLENPDQTFTAADLARLAQEEPGFQPANTVARMENGQLVSLERSYTP